MAWSMAHGAERGVKERIAVYKNITLCPMPFALCLVMSINKIIEQQPIPDTRYPQK